MLRGERRRLLCSYQPLLPVAELSFLLCLEDLDPDNIVAYGRFSRFIVVETMICYTPHHRGAPVPLVISLPSTHPSFLLSYLIGYSGLLGLDIA